MSNYTTQLLPFSPISGKKVEADFDGGEATSDAGVLLLRETEAHVGILSAIASAIHDLRDLRYVDHYLWDMIAQQQLALFNAYYDSRCYLPLHVYEGLSGKLITSILRPGSRPTGKQVVAILNASLNESGSPGRIPYLMPQIYRQPVSPVFAFSGLHPTARLAGERPKRR